MKRILGIGNALVDVMTLVDNDTILEKFSLPKGSMQLVDKTKSDDIIKDTSKFKISLTSGGSSANTIYGLAMLGADTGFIGTIGRDETGDLFNNDMKHAGVKTFLLRRESVTGTAVAIITPDSERTFATHLGAAVELNAEDLTSVMFDDYDILYLEGYLIYNLPLVEKACRIAREKEMKVALDLASYNIVEANLDAFRVIIEKYVDIIFANEQEAEAFTGLKAEESLKIISEYCEIVIIKIGSGGSWIKRGEEIIKIGSFPVNCIDTTGAGDLYASGFLYSYAQDSSLDKCGLLGAFLAGKVIEIPGARLNDEKWAEIKADLSVYTNPE
ncbi:MAG: adenosine kinase [Bacteroidales bacterium]|jgi:sugar/nucleoside kinase (ribokinase family)|nr:adenosine kinase [Bacteroidales bacterium]